MGRYADVSLAPAAPPVVGAAAAHELHPVDLLGSPPAAVVSGASADKCIRTLFIK